MADAMYQRSIKRASQKADLQLHHQTLSCGSMSYFDNAALNANDTLIFLHDHGMDKTCWLAFARLFPRVRLIIPDLPGHGLSEQGMEIDYGISHQAGRLHEFVQALKLKSRLYLLGHGSGATIALHLAARQPDLVDALIVIAALGVERTPSDLKTRVFGIGNNPMLEIRNTEDYRKMRQISMSHPPYLPAIFIHLLTRQRQVRQDLDRKISRDMEKDINQINSLRQIGIPTCVIWGEQDRIAHVHDASLVCEMIANSKKILLPDVGHAPMLERAQITAQHCQQFLHAIGQTAI